MLLSIEQLQVPNLFLPGPTLALCCCRSGLKKRDKLAPGQSSKPQMETDAGDNVDSERMLAE